MEQQETSQQTTNSGIIGIPAATQSARSAVPQLNEAVEKKASVLDRISIVNTKKQFGIALLPFYRVAGRIAKSEPCAQCQNQTIYSIHSAGRSVPQCLSCSMDASRKAFRNRAGQILQEKGLITPDQRNEVLMLQKSGKKEGKFLDLCVQMGLVKEADALSAWSSAFYFDFQGLTNQPPARQFIEMIPQELRERYGITFLGKDGQAHILGMTDPLDEEALLAAAETLNETVARITIRVLGRSEMQQLFTEKGLDRFIPAPAPPVLVGESFDEDQMEEIEDIPVVPENDLPEDAVDHQHKRVLLEAVRKGASDIHWEFEETHVRIRLRIDGEMQPPQILPKIYGDRIVRKIKAKAGIPIEDREDKAYDGSFRMKISRVPYDFRVGVIPGYFGPNCVIRVLDRSKQALTLDQLGYDEENLLKVKALADRGVNGLVLVSGPTGSGKTTTLASMMTVKAKTNKYKILSFEEPVEQPIYGVVQVPIDSRLEHRTYEKMMKAAVRVNPDLVVVGEVRCDETAAAAIEMAAAGQLVMCSIHTNSAVGIFTRLKLFGADQFLIADSTRLGLAQRLLRRLCPLCQIPESVSAATLAGYGFYYEGPPTVDVYTANPEGCDRCLNGYKGRTAIVEALEVTPEIRKLILKGVEEDEIEAVAIEQGMSTLKQSGLKKVLLKETSIDEVLRMTGGHVDPTVIIRQRQRSAA